jgi:uncharacterized protein
MRMTTSEIEIWTERLREIARMLSGDSAHDFSHLSRVFASACRLAKSEDARLEVIVPAAWLHDCVVVPKDSPARARASALAADRAIEILREIGYPADLFDSIRHCIEAHSFSAGIEPETLEAAIVQDADRLDALGAIGIARCFAVGGSLGRPIYSEVDPFCRERAPDDATFGVDHFFQKLFRIAATMRTAAGLQEATRRVEFMRAYLVQLDREITGGERPDFPISERESGA